MWSVKNKAEVRLSREDLHEAISVWLHSRSLCGSAYKVSGITLHPKSDCVIRIQLETTSAMKQERVK